MVHKLRRLRRSSLEPRTKKESSASVCSSRTIKANNRTIKQTQRSDVNDSRSSISSPEQSSRTQPPKPTSRPTIVRRMTSGTLGNDDSIRFDEQRQQQQQQRQDQSNNLQSASVKPPLLKKPSKCESEDDTAFEASSFSSIEDTIHVRKLPGSLTTPCWSKNDPEALKAQEIFATLTEEDKETAARTSWKYLCEEPPTDLRWRDALARAMVERHLVGEGGDVQIASEKVHNTLQGRREQKLDWVRKAWHPSPDWTAEQEEFSAMVRTKMSGWLGPHGRVCLMDYDEDDRCNYYHKLAIFTEGQRYEREAILYTASYMVEKAIACTERRSKGRQSRVNVVLDFRDANMRDKNQTLPISIALEIVELIKDHHPDRLWCIYMIDAPFLARFAWPIFRHFVNHIVQGGVKFVTGRRQILKTFGPKMLHFDRASNLDMDKFFQLPFDQAYEDVHGQELEY